MSARSVPTIEALVGAGRLVMLKPGWTESDVWRAIRAAVWETCPSEVLSNRWCDEHTLRDRVANQAWNRLFSGQLRRKTLFEWTGER